MPFPNLPAKHALDPYVTPAQQVQWWRDLGRLEGFRAPEGVVLVYQPRLYQGVVDADDARPAVGGVFQRMRLLGRAEGRVGVVGGFGFGAPAAAVVLEGLIALGVDRFISVGTAGALQPGTRPGDLAVCTGAVRDEGVSHHYLPSSAEVAPSPNLTAALEATLHASGRRVERGPTWTIDAPYRETLTEVRHYQAAGVRSVEMEAAALFAITHVRSVEVAAGFCYSDLLCGRTWEPHFDSAEVAEGLDVLFQAAVLALFER